MNVTYTDLITHTSNLGIPFIPWENCKRGACLAEGASMNVFVGTCEINGVIQNVAFKSVKASLTRRTEDAERSIILRDIKQEICIMGSLKGHSRIVQILAVSFNDHIPILVLELAKSNLEDYLRLAQRTKWKIKLGFMYDIALGLEAIHKIRVVHGDLKASNILLYDANHDQTIAKISDFGFSSTNFSIQAGRSQRYTPNFRSRESFDDELSDWNEKPTIDIYSYGLVVYQIAENGAIPFDDYSEEDINIMKKKGTELAVLLNLLTDDVPMEVRKVIMATIRNVPSERASLDEIKITLKECKEWDLDYSYEEAKTAFESLAQAGPQENILIRRMEKLPIPPSLKTSIFHEYIKLTDAGDVAAMFSLGSCWYFSFGVEKDYLKAYTYFKSAAEAGNVKAQYYLGYCYEAGQGVAKDYIKAVEWYTKAAEVGSTAAQNNLGACYANGRGVTKDYIKAFELYLEAAEAGEPVAQSNVGYCYQFGDGVAKDYTKAVEWYKKAAEIGLPLAQGNLGYCYKNGQGVTKDYVKAAEWYAKAAEAGHTYAQTCLGSCYYNGEGVTKDYIKAVELYTKAAETGDISAQKYLGMCYYNGHGVVKDYVKTIELYTKAAKDGDTQAQCNTGFCYYDGGYGVDQDYIKAVEWFTKAAESGNISAQRNLVTCYFNGHGVDEDYIKAFEWCTKASETGDASAKNTLGSFYEYGVGVAIDYAKAIELYTMAAEGGVSKAHENLDRLKSELASLEHN